MRPSVIGALLALHLLAPGARAAEPELQGLVTNSTVSRTGQAFYRSFCERLGDIGPLDFNLAVKERPSAHWGILLWVEFGNAMLYRRFLQPNVADMREIAHAAADQVVEQVNRARVQALFQDTFDLAKDEL
ncbi:CsgE family curli-type amyloid fiber assembly protein [Stutzerimonas azotifigens]|uniref:CsgE family curli-type amyloid fiber assembly protein n=1 Tax=Stutzerimonas azotifigens TaxID=291995 RepID=UPI0003F9801E|nr:CsgE family curli-type amyloid fiber assembly protein [Stutzerimonas azotifigens]